MKTNTELVNKRVKVEGALWNVAICCCLDPLCGIDMRRCVVMNPKHIGMILMTDAIIHWAPDGA